MQEYAYATLGMHYIDVGKGSGKKQRDKYVDFGDQMWYAWDNRTTHLNPYYEDLHAQRQAAIETYFKTTLAASPGYAFLGEAISRYALKSTLATYIKDSRGSPSPILPALRGNSCLDSDQGLLGVFFLDQDTTFLEAIADAIYHAAIQPASIDNLVALCTLQVPHTPPLPSP